MVSIAVSKMGMTELIFVDLGTKLKVNAQYYCDVLFSQPMLPAIKHVANSTHIDASDHFYVSQWFVNVIVNVNQKISAWLE